MTDLFDRQHHTIVVGGGLAGLAAATYLARAGARVTVLEKSPSLGGRATSDMPQGFALNRGAHALYTGGPASSVLRELDIRYSAGVPSHVFTRDRDGLNTFPASPASLLRTGLLSGAAKRELLGVFVRVGLLKPERAARQSIADWITANTHQPAVRQFLRTVASVNTYSTALDLASADAFIARIQQTLRHPIHYVDGGWQSLVNALRDAGAAAGVQIETAASVETVLVEAGSARGVVLHDGRHFESDSVVIAAPAEDALRLLPAEVTPHLAQAVGDLVPVHVACLDLALDALPAPQHPVVFDLEQPRFLTVQSQFAKVAPAGGAVLHAMRQYHPRQPVDAHQLQAELEDFIDEVQPGWRMHVVERHFMPNLLASSALPLASNGGLGGRIGSRSQDVENLYFAGDWVGPHGYLVDATLNSARDSARSVLRDRRAAAEQRPLLRAA
jgi:phytoene dehydrogenase-like protein